MHLRRGDRGGFEKLLRENPKAAQAKGSGGSTPLMYAALYARTPAPLRLLLEAGADPNIRNDAGATRCCGLWTIRKTCGCCWSTAQTQMLGPKTA